MTIDNIAVAGAGYVGLTTSACLAELGYGVTNYDIAAEKVASLRQGRIPFTEPGLQEMVVRNMAAGRLRFTHSHEEALTRADMVFICVGTPPGPGGEADLSQVMDTGRMIAEAARHSLIVVLKSTVPPGGAAEQLEGILNGERAGLGKIELVVNPEFLREGSAVYDFFHPDRVVIGARSGSAAEAVASLYESLGCPVLFTDMASAQLIKYASNAFLAMKISFINEISRIAGRVGADIRAVAEGVGLDVRIGADFLEPGLGYGGSCFPKDVSALVALAESRGVHPELLRAALAVNARQREYAVQVLQEALGGIAGKRICVLGLAFKPETDDVREAPALDVIAALCRGGAQVSAFDPAAMEQARRALAGMPGVVYCRDADEAASGCDAIVVATNWPQFKSLDWARIQTSMAGNMVLDGRGMLSAEHMSGLGFHYRALAN